VKRAEIRAAEEWAKRREAAAMKLPQEPEPSDPRGVITFSFKLPGGSRLLRRVAKDDPIQVLFDFVQATGDEDTPNGFNLVASYPRRVFTAADTNQTVQEAGLQGPQEALMLEVL